MRVLVSGRLKSRSYETKEGEKRTVVELEVDEVGPSLRYATAKVNRTSRGGGAGGFGAGGGGQDFGGGGYGGAGGGQQSGGGGQQGGGGHGGQQGGGGHGGGQSADDPWATGQSGGFGGGSTDEPPF